MGILNSFQRGSVGFVRNALNDRALDLSNIGQIRSSNTTTPRGVRMERDTRCRMLSIRCTNFKSKNIPRLLDFFVPRFYSVRVRTSRTRPLDFSVPRDPLLVGCLTRSPALKGTVPPMWSDGALLRKSEPARLIHRGPSHDILGYLSRGI